MIANEYKELARWAMGHALKNGCQAAQVSLNQGSSSSFKLRDARMDTLQQSTQSRMSLFLYVDGRYGTYSTNRLDKGELERFIANGIESTRFLAKDEARVLPDEARYYKGGKPDLQLLDPNLSALSPDEKVAMARAVAGEAMGKDPRIISVESSYGDGDNFSYLITSNGFEGETAGSSCSLAASVSVRGDGEARPSSYWYESSIHLDGLIREGIGKKALERTLRKIGQRKTKSGKYTMVVDPMNSARLLRPLLNAITGSALQQKNSFLLDRLGQKVGSDKLTLVDEPHLMGAPGARYFDDEGVATERRVVFGQGVLKTYYIDTYNAKKMDVQPTISGPSVLLLKTGEKDLDGLVTNLKHGILVTGFNGGNCNSSTGDFSYGIEGFLVENGALTTPLAEMNVTGNMIDLWNGLTETGNDPRLDSSLRVPSLLFEGVDFSGL